MNVDLGEEPQNKNTTFTVTANIYSEEANDYIHTWTGGTFKSYDEAYEFWDEWEPPQEEIDKIMKLEREQGDYSHHELEIGVWSNDPDDDSELAFMNRTIDVENERH